MTREEKEEQEFLAKKAKESDDTKTKKAEKGKEPWRYKHISGKAHPDNKPPVTIIAEASEEAQKKYEDSINAEREKLYVKSEESEENGG